MRQWEALIHRQEATRVSVAPKSTFSCLILGSASAGLKEGKRDHSAHQASGWGTHDMHSAGGSFHSCHHGRAWRPSSAQVHTHRMGTPLGCLLFDHPPSFLPNTFSLQILISNVPSRKPSLNSFLFLHLPFGLRTSPLGYQSTNCAHFKNNT